MFKKIALGLVCVLSLGALNAEELKIGYVNTQEILTAMPEKSTIEKKLSDLQSEMEKEMVKMREEYSTKIKEYQEKQATMPETIKQARQTEIQEIEQRITTFQQTANTDLQKKQQELFAPIIDKVKKAINEIGAETKCTYVFDLSAQAIVYQSPSATDLGPLVKKKLGLDKPVEVAPATVPAKNTK
jgi:outer membrane protein